MAAEHRDLVHGILAGKPYPGRIPNILPGRQLPLAYRVIVSPACEISRDDSDRTRSTHASLKVATDTVYMHEHFAFQTADNVVRVIAVLQDYGYNHLVKSAFLDEYYDTEDDRLMGKNMWLRRRDGHWVLLTAYDTDDSTVLTLLEQRDEDAISQTLQTLGITTIAFIEFATLRTMLPNVARQNPNLIHRFQRACPKRRALLPTCRLSLRSQNSLSEVRLDSFKFQDHFYTVGCIQSVDPSSLEALRTAIATHTIFSDHSPTQTVTSVSFLPCSETLDVTDIVWQTMNVAAIPEPLIPYAYFDRVTHTAVEAMIPLTYAYHAVLVQEQRDLQQHEIDATEFSDDDPVILNMTQ